MNRIKLKVIILEHEPQYRLANALEINKGTLSMKLNDKLRFTQAEKEFINQRYKLTAEEVKEIWG